jgi:hypothetical protein
VIATAADCQDANSVGRNPLMTARSQRSALAAYAQPGLPVPHLVAARSDAAAMVLELRRFGADRG